MTGKWSKAFWDDLAERVASTFLAAFIPAYVAAANVAHLDWRNALEISASAAGLSLLKGLAANLASPGSGPSLLNAPPGPVEVNDERGAVSVGLLVLVAVLVFVVLIFFGFHGHH